MNKSKGHMLFYRDHTGQVYEIFRRDGCLIAAPIERPVMPDGYRCGVFWSIDTAQHQLWAVDTIARNGWELL